MGGFLQSVLFGYTGLRLREEGLTFSAPPAMPNNVTSLVVHSLAYQGFQLRFERAAGKIRFDVLETPRSGGTLLVG
jgi:trehalose/maltose hydrolase-like predicted phosphorylase